MRARFVLTTAVVAFYSTPSLAQSMPQKPFSQWTQVEQQQYAGQLKQICNAQCAQYMPRNAATPAQRALYEASACQSACFARHLPTDYPGLAGMNKSALDNYNQAKALGSTMPVPVMGR